MRSTCRALARITVLVSTLAGMVTASAPFAAGAAFQILHDFLSADQYGAQYGVTIVGSRLYGTTQYDLTTDRGTAYSMNLDGSDFQELHSFASPFFVPISPLTAVGSTLFGTSEQGSVYSMNLDGSNFQERVISGGSYGGLTTIGSVLYGTAYSSSEVGPGHGLVFSMNMDGTNYQELHSFTGGTAGEGPRAGLTLIGSKFYGTTSGVSRSGANLSDGTVFSLNVDGSGFQTLHSFSGADGNAPLAGLTLVGSKLYGTTSESSAGAGTLFSLNLDGSGFQTLHVFPVGATYAPWAGVTLVGSRLYGTTVRTIYSVNLDGSDFQTHYSFSSFPDGWGPQANLVLNGSTLYGATDNSVFAFAVPEPGTYVLAVIALVSLLVMAQARRRNPRACFSVGRR